MRHSRFRTVIAMLTLAASAGCAAGPGGSPLRSAFDRDAAPTAAGPGGGDLALAASALQRGDAKTAATLYGQAAARDPSDSAAAMGLGEALLKLGQAAAAVDVYRGLVGTAATSEAQYGLGRALLASGRAGEAVDPLRVAQAAAAGDAVRAAALGVALDLSGRHADASAVYRAALASHPGDATLTGNLGLSLALGGQPAMAIVVLAPLAEGPSSTARLRQNLALAHGLAGNEEAARRVANIDLDADDVRQNLAIYAMMREDDGRDAPAPAAGPSPVSATRARAEAPSGGAKTPRRLVVAAAGDIAAPAPVASPGASAAEEPDRAAVATRSVASAAPRTAPSPAAPVASGPGVAAGTAGGWLLDLGPSRTELEAADRWTSLRGNHAGALAGLSRLAAGPAALVVGPVADETEARRRCAMLRDDVPACRVIGL